ncbi:hypothetical protein GCM10023216_05730 [Isoptericola chiayiensis]|uniref:Uncharacterized protein n=1 Tax=Isoptericola chiayiensis TaxID=579446 RepID=A0ABP8Y3E6_9MICO|nr:hypothetical protein [Isoptericola chiayiensis]NOV99467.1 hypothetical protein [Isoptericola chiayiensis]
MPEPVASPGPRYRLRHVLTATAVAVLALCAAGAAWAAMDGDPVDAPVTASTLDAFPARGSLIDSGDWAGEVEAAADVWRDEPAGGREEPPSDQQPISVLWAGDVSAQALMAYLRYELALDVPERPTLLESARAVVLRAGDRTALLIAKVEDDGGRDDEFTIVGDGVAPYLDGAALHPADGVVLLASDATGPASSGPATLEVVSAAAGTGAGARPIHDGLVISPPFDAARVPGDDVERLVRPSSGTTIETSGSDLWETLTGPHAASAWSALADTEEAAREQVPGEPVHAEVWGTKRLDDGRSIAVVAARTHPDSVDDVWWAASAGVLAPGDGTPWVHPLGRGAGTSTPHGTALPPFAGDWVVRDAEEMTVDLVVAAPPQVEQVTVEARDRSVRLGPGLTVLPSWEDDGGWPAASPVVLVGRSADGTPLAPLPH